MSLVLSVQVGMVLCENDVIDERKVFVEVSRFLLADGPFGSLSPKVCLLELVQDFLNFVLLLVVVLDHQCIVPLNS